MIKAEIKTEFDKIYKMLDSRKIDTLDYNVAINVWKDSNYYIPMDTGRLLETSYVDKHSDPVTVNWVTSYAKKVYFASAHGLTIHQRPETRSTRRSDMGLGPALIGPGEYTDQMMGNPNAREQWFEEARATKFDDWKRKLVEDITSDF